MEKKLIVFSTVGLNLPHLGLELEAIHHLKDNYKNLELVTCNINLPSCYLNPTQNLLACTACQVRTNNELKNRFNFSKIHFLPKTKNKDPKIDNKDLANMDGLMNLSYNGIDYGRGIASSLISIFRNADIELSSKKQIIDEWASWCIEFIDFLPTILSMNHEVLIFNGRFFETYPIISYCEQNGITFFTHEKGSNFSRYQLIKNSTPHSLVTRDEQMRAKWNPSTKEKIDIATKWFEDKRTSKITTEKDFTKEQQKGSLPEDFNHDKHNVVIFNSSEDEFKSIKEWNHDLYNSQNELIYRLATSTLDDKSIHYTLRFHPNLAVVGDYLYTEIKAFNLPNLTVVGPREKIDSYSLLANSDKVLTFGSRMSIEAAYSRIPSIIFGNSFYNPLESLYTPTNFDSLKELITNKSLKPIESNDYLMAAYFLLQRGEKCIKVDIIDKNNVTFEEQKLKTNIFNSAIYFAKNMRKIKQWVQNLSHFNRGSLLKNIKKL